MNFSIKKMFCAVICGVLLVTAVPAQAFSFNLDYVKSWFTPKMTIATAAVTAGFLLWKYFASKKIVEVQGIEDLPKLIQGKKCKVTKKIAGILASEVVVVDDIDPEIYMVEKAEHSKSYGIDACDVYILVRNAKKYKIFIYQRKTSISQPKIENQAYSDDRKKIHTIADLRKLNTGEICDVANEFEAQDGHYNFMVPVGIYTIKSIKLFNNDNMVMYELMSDNKSHEICMKNNVEICAIKDLEKIKAGDMCSLKTELQANDGHFYFMIPAGTYTVKSIQGYNNDRNVVYELNDENKSYQICMSKT